jgi:hypothetical protein
MPPFPNADGLQRARAIVDCAVANLQQAQALEQLSLQTGGFASSDQNFQQATMCAMMEMQFHEQQRIMMQELAWSGQAIPAMLPPPLPGVPPAMQMMPNTASVAHGAVSPGKSPKPSQPAKAAGGDANSSRRRAPQTLSTSLRLLEDENADCVLIVRRISKLGFKATRSLKQHFASYGQVVKVLLAHSTARQYNDQQFHIKRRPSNLGFVQMATNEAAQAILAQGSSHEIEGVSVSVQRFERHGDLGDEEAAHMDSEEQAEVTVLLQELAPDCTRFERTLSDASTSASSARA